MIAKDVVWSLPLDDYSSTPINDVHALCLDTLVNGDFRVLEVSQKTWSYLMQNTQVLSRLMHRDSFAPVKRKCLSDVFGVDYVSTGYSDVLYIFGSKK